MIAAAKAQTFMATIKVPNEPELATTLCISIRLDSRQAVSSELYRLISAFSPEKALTVAILPTTSAKCAVRALDFLARSALAGVIAICDLIIYTITINDSTAIATAYCQYINPSTTQTEIKVVAIGMSVKMIVSQKRSIDPLSLLASDT